jgi:tetratricopeptide (TPR) repeat protein
MGDLHRDRLESPKDAKKAYEQAIELDATCTPAGRGLAAIYFEEKEWALAAKYAEPLLARATELDPAAAREISVMCGDAFAKIGQFEKAQRAYLNAKAFAPGDRDVLERVADVTFDSGEPDEAAELYRDLLKRFGGEVSGGEKGRILFRLGEASRRAGAKKEAITYLEQAADLMRESPEPLSSLAKVYEDEGAWDHAIKTLRRRMEHAGDDERFDLLVRVGDVLLEKMGDRQKASKSYTAALEIKADDRNLLTKLMAVYSESKDWSRLVEVILRIAELVEDPRQLSKYYNTAAAISHQELGRLDEASDYYEQALENDPKLESAFNGLVDCLGKRKDFTALADAYRTHIARLGDGSPAEKRAALYDALAEVLEQRLNATSDAVEAFEKAQELDPENRTRAEKLASIYDKEPKRYFQRAVHAHGVILQKSPYRVESYQALRKLYTDMKRPDESWCVCQALNALNMAEPDEASFFKKHRTRSPANAQEFFNEEVWFNHIVHPWQDPLLTGIFAQITSAVVKARAQSLDAFKVSGEKKNAEQDKSAMAQTLHWAANVAQIRLPDVYYRESDPGGLSYLYTDPPAIGLGKGALAGGPSQALAFVAGRHLTYFRPGFYLRHLVPTGSGLRAWLLAAIKTVQPQFPVPGDLSGPVTEHLGSLKQHLTGQAKDELTSLVNKLLSASPSLDMKKWVSATDLTADRVGFVLANDLEIALAIVRASPEESAGVPQKDRLKELHLYAVSEEYLQLRHKIGIAIGD